MNKNSFALSQFLCCLSVLFFGCIAQVNAQNLIAVDDTMPNIAKNNFIEITPLLNDTKPTNPNLKLSIVQPSTNVAVSINADGFTVLCTPDVDFEGRDTMTYEVCDLDAIEPCSQAKVFFSFGKVPTKPKANPDTIVVGQNAVTLLDVQKNDVLSTATSMQIKIISNPKNGAVPTIENGKIKYTPNLNFVGRDTVFYALVDTFTFKQVGRVDSTDENFVAITVNSLHTAGNETIDTLFLPQATIKTKNVLKNNIDAVEKDRLFPSAFNSLKLTYNESDSTFTYKPVLNFTGNDTITYEVCSVLNASIALSRQCVKDTLFAVVVEEPVNFQPVITLEYTKDTILYGQNGQVTILATDKQDIVINSIIGLNNTSITLVSLVPNVLTFSYKVFNQNLRSSNDTISVKICEKDLNTSCATAKVILTLKEDIANPIAKPDEKTLAEDETVVVEVLKNDALNKSTITSVTLPKHGALDTTGNKFKYTPFIGYNGADTAFYTICRDSCSTTSVSFKITPIYRPLVVEGVSPDGDGINDAFGIQDIDYKVSKVSVQIFNRWGTKIFSEENYDANNPDKSWAGQSDNGEEVLDGTYFYIVEIPSLKFKDSGYLMFIGKK